MRAVRAVDDEAVTGAAEAHDLVAGDRVTALRELDGDAFIATDDDLRQCSGGEGLFFRVVHQANEAVNDRIQRYEILLEFLRDEKQQDEAFFRQMMVLDLYARENMKTRPRFAKDPSEWKNESRDFYQKEAETRTLLPSYTTYDWKQLQRMTHVEVFDYDVLGNGEKARTVLLFDYQKRDPLTGNAEMIDCSELFYA